MQTKAMANSKIINKVRLELPDAIGKGSVERAVVKSTGLKDSIIFRYF